MKELMFLGVGFIVGATWASARAKKRELEAQIAASNLNRTKE